MLDLLKAGGIPRAIATASGLDNVKFYIRHLALDKWFKKSNIVYDDGSFPGKPAPDIYLKAAGKLALAPSDCVVIEDSYAGLVSARRAGIGKIVAVESCQADRLREKVPGISLFISDFRDINLEMLLD